MSENLHTIDGVVLFSMAYSNGEFGIMIFKNGAVIAEERHPSREYEHQLQDMWENYIAKSTKPSLLDHVLAESSFIDETYHVLTSGTFRMPDCKPLHPEREKLLYWLTDRLSLIECQMDPEVFARFGRMLNGVLRSHWERKHGITNDVRIVY